MGKRKYIIAVAILAMLGTGFNAVKADSINSLLQMDVKKSSVNDTVDVTFYTTGNNTSSVVTRKSSNRYVVLLPGTSSSASVAPGIGGVKDLITDIDVKHVNDGMGGYTKVTFGTTKPINIKTYMKKTNPLTQAQKDSQAIIAKNNAAQQTQPAVANQQSKAQSTAVKTVANTTQAKPAPAQARTTAQKPAAAPKTPQTPKIIPIELPKPKLSAVKPKSEKPKTQPAVAPKAQQKVQPKVQANPVQSQPVQPQEQVSKTNTVDNSYVPKMKYDESGKRLIDLEPRVSHSVVTDKPSEKSSKETPVIEENTQQAVQNESETTPVAVELPQNQKSSHHFPLWILFVSGSALVFGLLYLVFDALAHANKKDQSRLLSFHTMSSKNQAKRRRREYYDIVNNEQLNWQEKYKLYTEKEEKRKSKEISSDMSYITDMSGVKKAIVMPQKQEKTHTQVVREKLQAKISQMEHSLAQTPGLTEPENVSNEVKSEDNAIINKMSDIKLKSFSKPATLKETHRTLAEEEKSSSRNKSYKEGRFVKLKNSPLSVTLRKSLTSELGTSDLIDTGNKYLTNSGVMKMNKENENYLVSSLDEYLSILDTEPTASPAIAKTRISNSSNQKSSISQVMTRSGVTNPIARGSNPIESNEKRPLPYMNGLIVKSGYNIDSEKGFYLVNIDGVSALVGRIKDSIFILKKFDHVVDKPLQVRPDDGNVYIVRVGKFKCLVDVSKEKMGTLIEI